MTLQGKGFFTFIIPETEGGDPQKILVEAQAAGLSHVLVKIADGPHPFGFDANGKDVTAPVVQALRINGIAVWGWHYVYGYEPQNEARVAIQRVRELNLDGYVIDAENEYKEPGKDIAARKFMDELRAGLPTLPVALCSYRFPNYHPELPWEAFLAKCDFNMPQVYWEQAHNPAWQLHESKKQCDALPHARPYLATGPAYGKSGWAPTETDIIAFIDTARKLEIPAVNFFQWAYCRDNLPQLWDVIALYDWDAPLQTDGEHTMPETPAVPPDSEPDSGTIPPEPLDTDPMPVKEFVLRYQSALNSRKPEQVLALYAPDAVFVRGGVVSRGVNAIQRDYGMYLPGLPVGEISFYSVAQNEEMLQVSWEMESHKSQETLVLDEGKIKLHYTFVL